MNDEFSIGKRVVARVIKIMPFGVFVELEGTALIGLVKIPEISVQPIRHPSEIVSLGQMVEAEIIGYNRDNGQISLSMKRCQPN